MEASKTLANKDVTKKSGLAVSGRGVVSFEENSNDKDKILKYDKKRNHSSPSLARGLEVIVPSLKPSKTADQVSFDNINNSSPHMVSNSYVLTASEDENEPETVTSGGYFSARKTASTRKTSFERRGTINTINTNLDEDDEESDSDFGILRNLTDDAFDKYYRRKIWFLILIRACCIASVVSVCMNTPQTFKMHPQLRKITLTIDIVTGFILGCEAVIKILHKGFVRGKKSYLRSAGRIFELVMVLCILISIGVQSYEMTLDISVIEQKVNNEYLKYSFLRAPRPLLLLRVMKSMLNLSLPKTVSYRSMKQIWGVFLFTCYFVLLAGLLGIQMFGLMNFYCVKNGTDPGKVQQTDLLIPSTRCPPPGYENNNFTCPTGFVCRNLTFEKFHTNERPFEHILAGLLTVYEASSMEGWSAIMYAGMDIRFWMFSFLYSLALIIFVSILVKNVFIAIITEAFADLRLQVSKLSSHVNQPKETGDESKVLRRSEEHMSLVNRNEDLRRNYARQVIAKITRSGAFQFVILLCVLADAIIQSFFFKAEFAKYIQIVFTLLFLIETILKMIGLGRKQYFQSAQCVFEFILCVGSTVFLAPVFMGRSGFVVFQVMRPFRLVLVWSTLRSFLKRILGSGSKIGSLILFTLAALVIAAGISLQVFCGTGLPSVPDDTYSFSTFPQAIKSLFQIFMTEAWAEIMDDVLYRGGLGFAFLVFILFILFHFLAATILISVFVALILDNLELEEDVKIAKQRRMGEEVADTQEKLPARMRLYQNLKPRPKLTKIDYVETPLPKLRQSFVSNYVEMGEEMDEEVPVITNSNLRYNKITEPTANDSLPLNFIENQPMESSSLHQFRKQSSVTTLMQDALNKRMSISHHGNGTVKKRQKTLTKSFRSGLSRHLSGQSAGSRRVRDTTPSTPVSRVSSNQSATRKTYSQNRRISTNTMDRAKDIDVGLVRQKLEEAQRKKESQIEQLRENHPLFDKSLFIFSAKNPIRKFVQKIVHSRYNAQKDEKTGHLGGFSPERLKRYFASQTWLDWIVLFFTQVSIGAMFWESPSHRTFDSEAMKIIEYIFVVTTSIELTLKIISDGLILSPNALIRDFGNIIHVFIYIVSLIYIAWKPEVIPPGSAQQIILVLRALRPLRLITLAPPLRKVVTVLVSGYKAIIKVAILQLALMFVFASYGVQFLSGELEKCNDGSITTKANCTGVFLMKIATPNDFTNLSGRQVRILVPRVWRNPKSFNFDHMGNALLTLMEILSLEGWTEVRDIIEDKFGFFGSLYPHVYVFFASLIGLTLFIGVIVSNFNENKGTALLTVEQKRWKDLKKKILLAQPLHLPGRPPADTLRYKMYEIFIGKTYNRCYGILILINCGMLCYGQWVPTERDDSIINSLTYVSIVCCMLFTIDTLLKIYIFQWSGYWLSWRNRFDFLLMICGLIFSLWNIASCHGVAQDEASCNYSKQFGVAVFILRYVSLSGKHNILRMLMLTVVISLTKSFYTIAVLVCIMFCYAFVGVILFGSVKPGLAITRNVNFTTSYYAFLLLFRVATGEDWNQIMHDAMITKPYCTELPNENYWESTCGNPTSALIYFHSYYLIISYIFLNLFIAVVIENFSIFYSTDDDPIMSQQDIQCFQETWNLCDEEKSGSMSLVRAKVVLRLLQGGLALDKLKIGRPLIFRRMVAELEKVKTQKKVTFHNLLFVIAYNKIDFSTSLQLDERLTREELEGTILEEVATETIKEWITMIIEKRRKEKKPKSTLQRRFSGLSSNSLNSVDSLDSDRGGDDLNASTLSLSAHPSPKLGALSPASSYETSGYEPQASLRQRKLTNDRTKEKNDEFYSWWGENVAVKGNK